MSPGRRAGGRGVDAERASARFRGLVVLTLDAGRISLRADGYVVLALHTFAALYARIN